MNTVIVTMNLLETIETRSIEGRLPCAAAFDIAASLDVSPKAVREEADRSDVRISHCQLGLFGFDAFGEKRLVRTLKQVPEGLADALRSACTEERLSCAAAWRIAETFGLPRYVVGCAAETLGLNIRPCQLGCF